MSQFMIIIKEAKFYVHSGVLMFCEDYSLNNIFSDKLMTADNKLEMASEDSHLLHQAQVTIHSERM